MKKLTDELEQMQGDFRSCIERMWRNQQKIARAFDEHRHKVLVTATQNSYDAFSSTPLAMEIKEPAEPSLLEVARAYVDVLRGKEGIALHYSEPFQKLKDAVEAEEAKLLDSSNLDYTTTTHI